MDKDFENFINFLNKKRKSDDIDDEQNTSMLNDFKYISTQRLLSLGDEILKLKGDKLIEYTIDLIKNFKTIINNTKNKKGNNLLDKSSSLILTIELSVSCIILKDIKKLAEQDKKLTFKKCIKLLEDKDKSFMEGCLKGGQEIKTFLKTEDTKESPMGLMFYMAKKNKK